LFTEKPVGVPMVVVPLAPVTWGIGAMPQFLMVPVPSFAPCWIVEIIQEPIGTIAALPVVNRGP